VPEALSLGVNWPVRESDHSDVSSAEVKNAWSYISTSPYVFMAWCVIKQGIRIHGLGLRHKDNLALPLPENLD